MIDPDHIHSQCAQPEARRLDGSGQWDPTTPSIAIKIISLRQSRERRDAVTRNLGSSRLPWSFFDALEDTIPELPYRSDLALVHKGRPLTRGEIGLFASHWSLWREHSAARGWMLVLEDDNMLDSGYDFPLLVKTLECCDVGYLRLGFTFLQPWRSLGWIQGQHLVRFRTGPYGTGAYLISAGSAARLMQRVSMISRPVDNEIDRFWSHGLAPIAIFPSLSLDTGWGRSILGPRETTHSPTVAERTARYIHRAAEKAWKTAADLELLSSDIRIRKILREMPMASATLRRDSHHGATEPG